VLMAIRFLIRNHDLFLTNFSRIFAWNSWKGERDRETVETLRTRCIVLYACGLTVVFGEVSNRLICYGCFHYDQTVNENFHWWRFGLVANVVGRVNEVNQRRARLVLGWGNVCIRVINLDMHPGQLSLLIPPWVGAMSTGESWDVNMHTVQCTSRVSVVLRCKLVSC